MDTDEINLQIGSNKKPSPRRHQYIPMNQLLDVQPKKTGIFKEDVLFFSLGPKFKSSMPSYHPPEPSGQPWSRLNLLPSEALRRATHVRRLQFRSGEPMWEHGRMKRYETPGARGKGLV